MPVPTPLTPFLESFDLRPWASSKARAPKFRGYALGQGGAATLQILIGDWPALPRQEDLRSIWKERNAGKPFPLLVVALYPGQRGPLAALCGTTGEDPPAYLDLDPGQVERLCEAALQEPDRHAAVRYRSYCVNCRIRSWS